MSKKPHKQCFACRVMRSFAITGAGAGLLGFSALYLGVDRQEAIYWALAGGLLMLPWAGTRGDKR